MNMKNKKKKGFTLVELIVVIAILGILAAVLIPKFGGFTDKAKGQQALVDAKQVATAIDSLIAEGKSVTSGADTTVTGLASVSGGTLNITDPTNGYFTYTVGSFSAGRNASTSGQVKLNP